MKDIDSPVKGFTHRNSTTALTTDLILMTQTFDELNQEHAINYKAEAIKGNFMPATLQLDNQQISINDIINPETGETLLHLAVHYSFYNVIRTLVEIFKADINVKNNINQTPLHLNCKNTCKDLLVLNYLINCPMIDIEAEDINGLRAIDYAVINNYNMAFLLLVSKGADLLKVDQMGNGLIYYALINDNKFIVSFLYTHQSCNTINVSFYDQQASLADVLITNKNTSVCKYIAKYHYEDIEEERIESCTQFLAHFPFYNRFNYEVINTMYFYKKRDYALFLNGLFPMLCCCLGSKRKKKLIINANNAMMNASMYQSNPQSFRLDTSINKSLYVDNEDKGGNIDIAYDNTQYNLMMFIKRYILTQYHKTRIALIMLYITMLIGIKIVFIIDKNEWFDILTSITGFFALVVSLLGIFSQCHHKSMFIKKKYSMKDNETNIFSKDIYDIPNEDHICEICLNSKEITTNHCKYCNKCVKDFYFHSILFNRCVNRTNVYLYNMFLYSMIILHASIASNLWKKYHIYSSNPQYFFTKIIITLCKINSLIIISIIYLIYITVIVIGILMTIIICIGTNTPYYNMFRYHHKTIGDITKRSKAYAGIPHVNLLGSLDFFKNLLGIKKSM